MKFFRPLAPRVFAATFVPLGILLLAGCGSGTSPAVTTPIIPVTPVTPVTPAAFSGKVFAGTKPIVDASIQLYAVGTTGTASQATSLTTTTILTDATGSFSVPTGYTCPASSSLLYIVARGGMVGTAPTNSAIVLLTPLGACNQIASQYVLNEVTTAASAWALSQFLSAGANIAATSTNSKGILNAFATAANLANPATGASPGSAFASADKAPVAVGKINSVANLLNTCTTSASACSSLFAAVTPGGASAPTNTLDAVLDIVRNPGNNVQQIFTNSTASTAFASSLTVAPADWTLYVNYGGGGMSSPTALGVDSTGSVWVANYFGVASKFSSLGQPVFASGISGTGLNDSYGLAIDASDNVWIPNEQSPGYGNSVTVLNSAGQSISGTTGFTSGGLNYPVAVAIDTNATAWIVDYGDAHVTLFSSSGAPLSGTAGYTGPSVAFPVSVAIDANHNAWIGDQNDGGITRFSSSGASTAFSCCNGPAGLATDQSGNLWVANYYGDNVIELNTTSGNVTSTATGGGIYHPQAIAVDGAGNIWTASFRNSALSQIAGATSPSPGQILSPSAGLATDVNLTEAYAIAIDASGNLWVSNYGTNLLTEFIGLAAPVKTPLIGPPQTP